jgi:predicted GNAT family N-acyltransferase
MTALVRTPVDVTPAPAPDGMIQVRVARTLDDVMKAIAIRAMVYMSEQTCPYEEEVDGNDFAGATHLLLLHGADPAGTLRLRWFAEFAKLERVAVRAEYRGGPGTHAMIMAAFDLAARKGYRRMLGHVEPGLTSFWAQFDAHRREGRPSFVFSDREYVEIEADLPPAPGALSVDTSPIVLLRPEGAWNRPGVLDRSARRPARRNTRRRRRCVR